MGRAELEYRRDTHNELDRIAKCSIQQSSKRLSQTLRYLLCSKRENGSQGNDSEEVQCEDSGRVPSQLTGKNADRDEDKEDVNWTYTELAVPKISISSARKYTYYSTR